MLTAIVGTSGGQQERRSGDRRKSEERGVGVSGANPVLPASLRRSRSSVNAESHREEGRQHRKLLVWDQDGNCREGKTPCVGNTTMFVESTWLAPIGSDITISLVPGEEDAVGQELARGVVVWHCPWGDEFGSQAGFGLLFQREWLQSSGPDSANSRKEDL